MYTHIHLCCILDFGTSVVYNSFGDTGGLPAKSSRTCPLQAYCAPARMPSAGNPDRPDAPEPKIGA